MADRRKTGLITSRNGLVSTTFKPNVQHKTEQSGERKLRRVQIWSPIIRSDGGIKVSR